MAKKAPPEKTLGQDVVEMLESECADLDITMSELCEEAGVNRSIPARWKDGSTPSPLLRTYLNFTRTIKTIRKRKSKKS